MSFDFHKKRERRRFEVMVLNIVYEEQKSEEERTHTLFHVFDGKAFNLRVRSDTKIAADDLSLTLVYAERLATLDNEEPPSEKMLTVRVFMIFSRFVLLFLKITLKQQDYQVLYEPCHSLELPQNNSMKT